MAEFSKTPQETLEKRKLQGHLSINVETSTPMPEYKEKRKFSLDFLGFRKGSKGKFDLLSKLKKSDSINSSTSSTDSRDDKPPSTNGRRRSSTRMEGKNSDIAGWCIG